MLRAGATEQTTWQRLRDEHDLVASTSSFQRARVTVLRDDPPAGQEAQIDYGYLRSWINSNGGRRRRCGVRGDVGSQPAHVRAPLLAQVRGNIAQSLRIEASTHVDSPRKE
uniref:hypothetical protein n=1 Tax=Pseudonocardia sp. CA-138482 TaxID=3240023 RepID=UPI003F493673